MGGFYKDLFRDQEGKRFVIFWGFLMHLRGGQEWFLVLERDAV
jgi:hypothetical protein